MVDRGIHDARRTEESTTHGGQWNSRRTVDRRIHDARRTEESTTLGDTGNPSSIISVTKKIVCSWNYRVIFKMNPISRFDKMFQMYSPDYWRIPGPLTCPPFAVSGRPTASQSKWISERNRAVCSRSLRNLSSGWN